MTLYNKIAADILRRYRAEYKTLTGLTIRAVLAEAALTGYRAGYGAAQNEG